MSSLTAQVPPHLVNLIRRFLQRADEFQQKDRLVAYFLRTHAADVALKNRRKDDKVGSAFIGSLLDFLADEKAALGKALTGVDGRTVVTKSALVLFQRADDERSAGQCNSSLVRLFFTAAVLFEASAQFTKDKEMDPIAAERCRYAKYTASQMKKSLDSGEPLQVAHFTEEATESISPSPLPSSAALSSAAQSLPEKRASLVSDNRPQPAQSQPHRPQPQPQPHRPQPQSTKGEEQLISMDDVFAAQKHAKQAVSALQFLDHQQAVVELKKALQYLEKH